MLKKQFVFKHKSIIISIVSLLLLLYAVTKAVQYRWVCDDAFISFRYAENLANGHGLRFNLDEKVEGYTNFLWTVFLSMGFLFKVDPIPLSQHPGINFYIGTLLALFFVSRKIHKQFIPLAFAGFAVHKHGQIFATSGLETSLFTFLVTLAYSIAIVWKERNFYTLSFFLLALSGMTRPDGMIFYAILGLYILWTQSKNLNFPEIFKQSLIIHAPLYLLFIPYWILRYLYYGHFFQNTFYAKSASLSYFEQGFKYIALYFQAYYVFTFIPILVLLWLWRMKSSNQKFSSNKEVHFIPVTILLLTTIGVYTLYIAKVGGDFMFGRFLIPITPLLYLFIEILFVQVFSDQKVLYRVAVLLTIFMSLAYFNPYKGTKIPIISGISEEHEIYKKETIQQVKKIVSSWKETFVKNQVRIAFGGSQAIFAFYLNPIYAIEAETGLTDEYLAHRKIIQRSRIGHEKTAPLEYLVQKNIHLHLNSGNNYPEIDPVNEFTYTVFPGTGKIIIRDEVILSELKKIGHFQFK